MTSTVSPMPHLSLWGTPAGAGFVSALTTSQFGVFQDYYQTHQLASNSATQISWIGSIQYCLCPMLGCISGPLFDAGYLRSLVATGGAIYVVCFMMASIAKEYYQFLLAHGIGGPHVLTKRVDLEPPLCAEPIQDSGIRMSGVGICHCGDHLPDHVEISVSSCRFRMGHEDK
jgi:hypothetical protein